MKTSKMYITNYSLTEVFPTDPNKVIRNKLNKFWNSDYKTLDEVNNYCVNLSHDFPFLAFKILAEGENPYDVTTLEFYRGKLVDFWEMPEIEYSVSRKTTRAIKNAVN